MLKEHAHNYRPLCKATSGLWPKLINCGGGWREENSFEVIIITLLSATSQTDTRVYNKSVRNTYCSDTDYGQTRSESGLKGLNWGHIVRTAHALKSHSSVLFLSPKKYIWILK